MIELHDLPQISHLADIVAGAPGVSADYETFLLVLQSMVFNTVAGAHRAGRYAARDDLLDESVVFLERCLQWSIQNVDPRLQEAIAGHVVGKAKESAPRVVVTGGALSADELAELLGQTDDEPELGGKPSGLSGPHHRRCDCRPTRRSDHSEMWPQPMVMPSAAMRSRCPLHGKPELLDEAGL